MSQRKAPRFHWMPFELAYLRRHARRIHAGKLSYYRAMKLTRAWMSVPFTVLPPSEQVIRAQLRKLVRKLKSRKAGAA